MSCYLDLGELLGREEGIKRGEGGGKEKGGERAGVGSQVDDLDSPMRPYIAVCIHDSFSTK